MRVALWGSYAYGNYGDELMALHFARHLQSVGAEPVVFQLRPELAARYGFARAETADEAVEDAAFCVFGGGSILSGGKQPPGWYAEQKRREYTELVEALERHRCPLHFASIGGDGPFGNGLDISAERQRLLESPMCRSATIRTREDVALIDEHFGIPATYYPDVLLHVRDFWNIEPPAHPDDRVRVGFNLPQGYRRTAWVIDHLQRLGVPAVLYFIRTVLPDPEHPRFGNELQPPERPGHLHSHLCEDPVETLRVLAGLDVIFSTKLHIGLTAMALGVPFVCVRPTLKSKAFLHEAGTDFAYWGDGPPWWPRLRMAWTALSPARVRALGRRFRAESHLEEQTAASYGHLDAITALVREYA